MARKKSSKYMVKDYVPVPRSILKHQNFKDLSSVASKILMVMYGEYRGYNNGDLSAAHSQVIEYGIKSKTTLHKALAELVYYKFLIRTFAGGSHHCSLYAVSWLPINDCHVDLQEPAELTPRWNEKETVKEKWTEEIYRRRKRLNQTWK